MLYIISLIKRIYSKTKQIGKKLHDSLKHRWQRHLEKRSFYKKSWHVIIYKNPHDRDKLIKILKIHPEKHLKFSKNESAIKAQFKALEFLITKNQIIIFCQTNQLMALKKCINLHKKAKPALSFLAKNSIKPKELIESCKNLLSFNYATNILLLNKERMYSCIVNIARPDETDSINVKSEKEDLFYRLNHTESYIKRSKILYEHIQEQQLLLSLRKYEKKHQHLLKSIILLSEKEKNLLTLINDKNISKKRMYFFTQLQRILIALIPIIFICLLLTLYRGCQQLSEDFHESKQTVRHFLNKPSNTTGNISSSIQSIFQFYHLYENVSYQHPAVKSWFYTYNTLKNQLRDSINQLTIQQLFPIFVKSIETLNDQSPVDSYFLLSAYRYLGGLQKVNPLIFYRAIELLPNVQQLSRKSKQRLFSYLKLIPINTVKIKYHIRSTVINNLYTQARKADVIELVSNLFHWQISHSSIINNQLDNKQLYQLFVPNTSIQKINNYSLSNKKYIKNMIDQVVNAVFVNNKRLNFQRDDSQNKIKNPLWDTYKKESCAAWKHIPSQIHLLPVNNIHELTHQIQLITNTPSLLITLQNQFNLNIRKNASLSNERKIKRSLSKVVTQLNAIEASDTPGVAAFHWFQEDSLKPLKNLANENPLLTKTVLKQLIQHINLIVAKNACPYINQAWEKEIQPFYTSRIAGHYPIDPGSSLFINLKDFTQFYGPNGLLSQFKEKYLTHLLGKKLLNSTLVSTLQKQTRIQEALYAGKADQMELSFSIKPIYLKQSYQSILLKLGKHVINYQYGPANLTDITWPSDFIGYDSKIQLVSFNKNTIEHTYSSTWGLLHLLGRYPIKNTKPNTEILSIGHVAGFQIQSNIPLKILPTLFQLNLPKTICLSKKEHTHETQS